VWSKSKYEEMMNVGADDFAALAEKVMGEIDLNFDGGDE
jgi:hypothetical protein